MLHECPREHNCSMQLTSVSGARCLPQVLSRAFRNRFLELHVGDIPDEELVTILQHRCQARHMQAQVFGQISRIARRATWE